MKHPALAGACLVFFCTLAVQSVASDASQPDQSQVAPEILANTVPLKKSEQRFLNRLNKMGLGDAELTAEQKSKIRSLNSIIQRKNNAITKEKTAALKEGKSTAEFEKRRRAVDEEFKAKLDEILTPAQSRIRAEILAWRAEEKGSEIIDPTRPESPSVRVMDGVAFQPKKSATQQKRENAFKKYYDDRIGDNMSLTKAQEESVKKIIFDSWTKLNQLKLAAFENATAKQSSNTSTEDAITAIWAETDSKLAAALTPEQFKTYRTNWIYSKLYEKPEPDAERKASVRQIAANLCERIPLEAIARTATGKQARDIKQKWKAARDAVAAIYNDSRSMSAFVSQAERRTALAKALSDGLDLDASQQIQVRKIAADMAKDEAEAGLASTITYQKTYKLAGRDAVERLMPILTPEQQATCRRIQEEAATRAKELVEQWVELGLASNTLTPIQKRQIEQILEGTTAKKQTIKEARAKAARTGGGNATVFQLEEEAANEALKTRLDEILTPAQRQLRTEALAKIALFEVLQTVGPNAKPGEIAEKSSMRLEKEQEYLEYYQARSGHMELTPEQEARFKEIIYEGWKRINMANMIAQEQSASGKANPDQQLLKIQEEMDNRVSALVNSRQYFEYRLNCIEAKLVDKCSPSREQLGRIRREARTLLGKIRALPPQSTLDIATPEGREHTGTLKTAWSEGYQAMAAITGLPQNPAAPSESERRMAIAQELSRDLNLTVEQQAQIRLIAAEAAKKESGNPGELYGYTIPAGVSVQVLGILTPEQRQRFNATRQK